MSFLYNCINALGSGLIVRNVYSQEFEAAESLHRLPANEQKCMGHQKSTICEVVVLAPLNQIIKLPPLL